MRNIDPRTGFRGQESKNDNLFEFVLQSLSCFKFVKVCSTLFFHVSKLIVKYYEILK